MLQIAYSSIRVSKSNMAENPGQWFGPEKSVAVAWIIMTGNDVNHEKVQF